MFARSLTDRYTEREIRIRIIRRVVPLRRTRHTSNTIITIKILQRGQFFVNYENLINRSSFSLAGKKELYRSCGTYYEFCLDNHRKQMHIVLL